MKKIYKLFNSKLNVFLTLGFLGIFIVLILNFFDKDFNFHDILVGLHGLIYDLFVFGIILTIYEIRKDRIEKIERYQEELNDFRFWKSEEAKFRIVGLVKRLVNLKVKKINLRHCFLENANNLTGIERMHEWDFSAANLNDTLWLMNDCTNSLFYLTELFQSSFRNVNLTNCKFESAKLYETEFTECNFKGVLLNGALVHTKNWFEEMKKRNNIYINELEEKFEIIEIPKSNEEKAIFKIVRK